MKKKTFNWMMKDFFLIKNKKLNFFTLANFLSIFRIILIFPFIIAITKNSFLGAGGILIISACTDFLDGFFARILNQRSYFGEMLDPVADKLTILAVMICVSLKFRIIIPFMLILILKEILMLISGGWLIKKNKPLIKARWYGKLGTAFFYFSIFVIVSFKALWNIENQFLIFSLMYISALLMIHALIRYFVDFLKLN
ncbi:MAG: CDP-alcohol phosphatidyltransferase family protein [Candidatus Improbicoccus devescovinae]|nr:MAG: CDP-alcohol phosphatidyltransferase family protein [Candidatus Improbicoccus devescovinae]